MRDHLRVTVKMVSQVNNAGKAQACQLMMQGTEIMLPDRDGQRIEDGAIAQILILKGRLHPTIAQDQGDGDTQDGETEKKAQCGFSFAVRSMSQQEARYGQDRACHAEADDAFVTDAIIGNDGNQNIKHRDRTLPRRKRIHSENERRDQT
jgi:hypothetical protein